MHKKFEVNRTKIKGGCQSCRKVVAHDSRSDLPLVSKISRFALYCYFSYNIFGKNIHFQVVLKKYAIR